MGGKRSKKPAPPEPHALRHSHEGPAASRAFGAGVVFAGAVVVALVIGANLRHPLPLAAAVAAFLMGVGTVTGILARGRLAACRALLDHEHWEPAIVELKRLHSSRRAVADEAAYLVALAYDRQGARTLALESYRAYLKRHKRGVWAVEARVRAGELEAAPQVSSRPVEVALNCPFCKADVAEGGTTVECGGCGTAHHAGCYEEQGGCAVYGCQAKTARARVRG
ncbi:MAG: hypothetical protein KF878_18365 [Planctomycetes bacterium]|nr:hypothetical protein [Planctomycetota bacterium]